MTSTELQDKMSTLKRTRYRLHIKQPFYLLISDEQGREIEEINLQADPELIKGAMKGLNEAIETQILQLESE